MMIECVRFAQSPLKVSLSGREADLLEVLDVNQTILYFTKICTRPNLSKQFPEA